LLFMTSLIWNLFFSRLRSFPGPALAKLTDFWRAFHTYRGRVDQKHVDLHRKYGTAVQLGPNCVSISDPSLIRTIYSTRNPWKKVRYRNSLRIAYCNGFNMALLTCCDYRVTCTARTMFCFRDTGFRISSIHKMRIGTIRISVRFGVFGP
jgi:hypothetical protein